MVDKEMDVNGTKNWRQVNRLFGFLDSVSLWLHFVVYYLDFGPKIALGFFFQNNVVI